MNFIHYHTFAPSLDSLPANIKKAAKNTHTDIQLNPANPGLQMHRLNKGKDPNFWSARVNQDYRIIIHRLNNNLVFCFVGKHDDAYQWAENRKLEINKITGAAQMVLLHEKEEIIKVPVFVEEEVIVPHAPPLLQGISDEELLQYGVPEDNLVELKLADEDKILNLIDDLPEEAAEAVLQLAAGHKPDKRQEPHIDPFEHPDAKRRFRILDNVKEFEEALEYDWNKWVVFLHPIQRDLVERSFNGPYRVSGTAGTGKTVVAIHRAVHLARTNESSRILLTTFSETLAALLKDKLKELLISDPSLIEQIEVISFSQLAEHLYPRLIGPAKIASDQMIRELLAETASALGEDRFSKQFIFTEWKEVVDAWQLDSWESYRTVPRIGRKTRLPESRRESLWRIFQIVKDRLAAQNQKTQPGMYQDLATRISNSDKFPYEYAIVDEAQDISVTQLRFLAALGGGRPDSLFFAGDLGQRIFQQPFSWGNLGVNIRGRSKTLKVNYRTSHQIRSKADLLLDPEIRDMDENSEDRRGTVSVFNGVEPIINRLEKQVEEIKVVSDWVESLVQKGLDRHEIAIFVRSADQLERAKIVASNADLESIVLDESIRPQRDHISLGTMHAAKGLEFRAVAVMGCDYDVIPSPERIEDITDEPDLIEVMNTERHLLYVACTRARDSLLITGVTPVSEFLDDLEIN